MVIGLFFHYLPIYKDINGIYCSTTLTDDLFSRYFSVVDELYVATRVYTIEKTYQEAHQDKISLPGVKIVEFPNLSNLNGLLFELPKAKAKVLSLVKKANLLFVRGGIIALLGVDAARKMNKSYLMECGGCAWDDYWNHSFSGKLIAPYMEYREKKDVRNASYVLYVTEKWLQQKYPTNGINTYASNVILNEIDEDALNKRLERISHFDKRELVIGTTGGVGNRAKGQQFVIEAISKMQNKYNIQYEIVGGGDRHYLVEIAKKYGVSNKVTFKGELTHREVLAWLDSIDIYIQPSMQEGLPRALIEAMSRACPAIGSTTGGIPELLEPRYIFKRGSVKDLQRVLEQTINANLNDAAIFNYNKSKEFYIHFLNLRREKLYRQYSASVRDL